MNSDKLSLIKKILEKQLDSFDFDKEIQRNEDLLSSLKETPADEYSFSGNIKYGITNLLNTATTATHPIGYLTAKKSTLKELINLLDKDVDELETILNHKPPKSDTSALRDKFMEQLSSEDRPKKKHFFDCELTDEDWGSENCVCPGAYIYRKYLNIGLSEEEAKLISDYTQLDDLMEDKERFARGKALHEKHKFLNVKNL